MTSAPEFSIVLPAYNEEAAIAAVIAEIKAGMDPFGRPYEVIVVDDGSTDQTAAVAEAASTRVVRHPYNMGVGAARKTGIRAARGEFIAMLDADGTYPARDLPRVFEPLKQFDMVVGARRVEAGTVRWLRAPVKWMIRKLAEYVSGHRIPDLNSGMRAFRRQDAQHYFPILPSGHSWVSTITLAFLVNDLSIGYVPIDYFRRTGRSTYHPLSDTLRNIILVVRTMMYFRPLKIFGPLFLLLSFGGAVRTCYDAWIVHDVKESDVMLILTAVLVGVMGLLADMVAKSMRQSPR